MTPTGTVTRRNRVVSLRSDVPGSRPSAPARRKLQDQRRRQPDAAHAVPKQVRKPHQPVLSAPKRVLPGWHDLAADENGRQALRSRHVSFLEAVSTTRFGVLILGIALAFTLYVGHVHATRNLLADLQTIRQENLRLHLHYNRLKGQFDQATGPSIIYRRANQLGFEEGIVYGPTIRVVTPELSD